MITNKINFPKATGIQVLMMPFIQGDSSSVPDEIKQQYGAIIENTFIDKGEIGFLTIDESFVDSGKAQRAYRSKTNRALHTEAGLRPNKLYSWGSVPVWGGGTAVTLDRDVKVLLANNIDNTCALWNSEHENTSEDGDIGHFADMYPLDDAVMMKAGEVHKISILTPHESLPVKESGKRQFIRIISSGVHGREPYFTKNPLMN